MAFFLTGATAKICMRVSKHEIRNLGSTQNSAEILFETKTELNIWEILDYKLVVWEICLVHSDNDFSESLYAQLYFAWKKRVFNCIAEIVTLIENYQSYKNMSKIERWNLGIKLLHFNINFNSWLLMLFRFFENLRNLKTVCQFPRLRVKAKRILKI